MDMVVLAASLLKFEDALSFKWAFEEFAYSMSVAHGATWFPRIMFTDSDPTMALAISVAFPKTVHLLCTYHIEQNVIKAQAEKLFPGAANQRDKQAFKDIFHKLLHKKYTFEAKESLLHYS